MATWPGRPLGSALLSGENLWSFCLVECDDNGAEHQPELCRRDQAADGRRPPLAAFAADSYSVTPPFVLWRIGKQLECHLKPPGTFLCFKP